MGGRDVKRNKPDPEGLHLAMTKLGLKPEQVLFCGDTVIDAQAAKSAGVDFCAVLNGTTPGRPLTLSPCPYCPGSVGREEMAGGLSLSNLFSTGSGRRQSHIPDE